MGTSSSPVDRGASEPGRPRVAVLGSARLGEQDPAWATALDLGRRLAEAGFDTVTGGYGGLMAAVSRGAHEAGGGVIGLAMSGWTHLQPNMWNTEVLWFDGYAERLGALLRCRGVIALTGGLGTLSELSVVWAARQTEADAPALVLLGKRWARLLDAFGADLVIGPDDMAFVRLAETSEEAVELLVLGQPPSAPLRRARG